MLKGRSIWDGLKAVASYRRPHLLRARLSVNIYRLLAAVVIAAMIIPVAGGGTARGQAANPTVAAPPSALELSLPATQLLLNRPGQTKGAGTDIEVKDRQYEGLGALPVTVNGSAATANEVKVISNLKAKAGIGDHKGTIDIDIPSPSGGHLTLEYQGTAMVAGANITSGGNFKVSNATGAYAGLRVQGTYVMAIAETGAVEGSPVTVSISASSGPTGVSAPQAAAPQPSLGIGTVSPSGPGYPTAPLDMTVPGPDLAIADPGQVKEDAGKLEMKGRVYEGGNSDDVAALPLTINGVTFATYSIRVSSDLKLLGPTGEAKGTVDIQVDAASRLTLQYQGKGMMVREPAKARTRITSTGTFKTGAATGIFAGMVADGTYDMAIDERGEAVGSKVGFDLTTVSGAKAAAAAPQAPPAQPGAVIQPAPGIVIVPGGISGPGYPTGPLDLSVPSSQLLLNRVGQVKEQPGQLEVKDRQYEGAGAFPVTINGATYVANELKVISNLKLKAGAGQHQGTIDVDIDVVPGGHLTLQYQGAASLTGATLTSGGTFKTSKTTGSFAGLVADGTYNMTIVESGSTLGAPATVTLTTVSTFLATQPAPGVTIVPGGVSGPGYPTGPLSMTVPSSQLLLNQVGQVKEAPGQLEIKDRQYEGTGAFPVTINGVPYVSNELKVLSNLKLKGVTGEHGGTIDVDIDAVPGGHLTLQYQGIASLTDATLTSSGTFKTSKTTGSFAGLVADGTYNLTIVELGNILGSSATVTLSTVSTFPPAPSATTPPAAGTEPAAPSATTPPPAGAQPAAPPVQLTGLPLLTVPSSQLVVNQLGQVKEGTGQLEVAGRQYEGLGAFPVTINGTSFTAHEVKVLSTLKLKDGVGDHQGTIDVDIDVIPGGHLTLEYRGTATGTGAAVASSGTFRTIKATDNLAGLAGQGAYTMTIAEPTPAVLGAAVTVTISTGAP